MPKTPEFDIRSPREPKVGAPGEPFVPEDAAQRARYASVPSLQLPTDAAELRAILGDTPTPPRTLAAAYSEHLRAQGQNFRLPPSGGEDNPSSGHAADGPKPSSTQASGEQVGQDITAGNVVIYGGNGLPNLAVSDEPIGPAHDDTTDTKGPSAGAQRDAAAAGGSSTESLTIKGDGSMDYSGGGMTVGIGKVRADRLTFGDNLVVNHPTDQE